MSDNERARDRRGGRGRRSRSPRRERGGAGRRDNRYRSRSPLRKDEREGGRGDRGRGDRGRGRGQGRDDRDRDRDRAPPTGPRGAPPSRTNDFRSSNSGPVKPPTGPRAVATAESTREDEKPDVEMKEERPRPDDMDDDTWEMQKAMGFTGFKSTKDTKVPGNDKNYGVRKDKQMEARQYMNRQGGFNRPLSPSRG